MLDIKKSYRNITLLKPDHPEYLAFLARIRDANPPRGGGRQAGEYLGGLVELCVRHWLNEQIPLSHERILSWEQKLKNGRHGTMFRELDAVWQIDHESFCLYELKFTLPEFMENGSGLKQLNIAANILENIPGIKYILRRIVYLSETPVAVLADEDYPEGIPVVTPDDETTDLGVIWVPMESIETAAQNLAIELPENWRLPEAREGTVLDAEQEEMRKHLSTVNEGATNMGNSLAEALQRALESH